MVERQQPLRLKGAYALGGAAALASAAAALSVILGESRPAVVLLAVAQACMVAAVGLHQWDERLQWARPDVLIAAAWALTFTIPSCIYAAKPTLMDVYQDPVEALCIVNLSFVSLVAGAAITRSRVGSAGRRGGALAVTAGEMRWPVLVLWAGIGVVGLALVFQGAGGPLEYVSNVNEEGRFNVGRVYLVWMALFLRYAAQILLFRCWAAKREAPWPVILLVAATIAVTALLGARLFVAVALVEIAVFYVLVRRPIALKLAVPVAVTTAFAVIVVGGATKRYTDYTAANPGPDKSLGAYLRSDAPTELVEAYANNYADGVRLIALSRATVPRYADYERGELLLRYAVQPIPRSLRPQLARAPAVRRALVPGQGYAHAIPLQASTYLQWGVVAVGGAFLLLGLLVGWLDRLVVALQQTPLTFAVLLTATIVAIPSFLRSSEAGGFAVAAMDVIGLGLVALTTDRRRLRPPGRSQQI